MRKIIRDVFSVVWYAIEKCSGVLILFMTAVLTGMLLITEEAYIGVPKISDYIPHIVAILAIIAIGSFATVWTHHSWTRGLYSFVAGVILGFFALIGIHAVKLLPKMLDSMPDCLFIMTVIAGILYIPILITLVLYIYFHLYCDLSKYIKNYIND